MSYIHTKIFDENKQGGLLIVGTEHGNSVADQQRAASGEPKDERKSFFSDESVDNFDIRNIMVKRFELWGYDLHKTPAAATAFDRSIARMNWLESCNQNTGDRNMTNECLENPNDFLDTCRLLRPRLIILLSHDMMGAFTDQKLADEITAIFGAKQGSIEETKKDYKFFRMIKLQRYERAMVVSMNHTAAHGISHEAIAAFKPEMQAVIDEWWQAHQKEDLS